MNFLFALLMAWTGLGDQFDSDSKVREVVKGLGSNSYQIRSTAEKTLIQMDDEGKLPLGHIYKTIATTTDLETKKRCQRVYRLALCIVSDSDGIPTPSIWKLRNKYRFPFGVKITPEINEPAEEGEEGEEKKPGKHVPGKWETPLDISHHYYVRARNEAKKHNKHITDYDWRHSDVETEATRMLITDLRRGGWSRRECERLLNKMVEGHYLIKHFNGINNITENQWIPGPDTP